MNTRLKLILDELSGRYGRAAAMPGHALEEATGIPEREIRRILKAALRDGTLDELQCPAIGINGIGFFVASTVEDYQAAHDPFYRAIKAGQESLAALKRLARGKGFHLLTPEGKTNER